MGCGTGRGLGRETGGGSEKTEPEKKSREREQSTMPVARINVATIKQDIDSKCCLSRVNLGARGANGGVPRHGRISADNPH